MRTYNLKLENTQFSIAITTRDGNQYIEKGQTMLTAHHTISDYLNNYDINDIEIYSDAAHEDGLLLARNTEY